MPFREGREQIPHSPADIVKGLFLHDNVIDLHTGEINITAFKAVSNKLNQSSDIKQFCRSSALDRVADEIVQMSGIADENKKLILKNQILHLSRKQILNESI